MPVERFQRVAETYGYIVAGSNTSRNGIAVRDAVNAMWEDTHARFAIDDHRVYATGFSGGARVATALALGTRGQIAGVIGCGAGFPPDVEPSKDLGFVYYGAVGTDDFNLPEMRRLADALEAASATYRIETWPGGHDWPPVDECALALEWLELHAMRAGTRPVDPSLVDAWRRRDEERARARETTGAIVDAAWAYRALAVDYEKFADVSAYRAHANELRSSKALRDAIKAERDDENKQRQTLGEITANLRQLGDAEFRAVALQTIRRTVVSLKKRSESDSDPRTQRVARRTLVEASIALQQTADALAQQRQYAAAALTLAICDEIRPNHPGLLYAIAAYHAQGGDRKRAIEALRRAVANGFSDAAGLEPDAAFASVRETPEFRELLDSARANSQGQKD
jgi:tetratricopeptide (TPR) repeat protein